jgi:hypothetical protein
MDGDFSALDRGTNSTHTVLYAVIDYAEDL